MTGPVLGFPAVWLRHNCPCPDCRDPVTGQRLIEITDIPNECAVTVETQTAHAVGVVFTPEDIDGLLSTLAVLRRERADLAAG